MYEKAQQNEIIWRWGNQAEILEHLREKSQEAEDVIGLHGVTAFAGKPTIETATVSYAKVVDLVVAGFDVYITPLDSTPEHRTVTLPKPVIPKMVEKWNSIWSEDGR